MVKIIKNVPKLTKMSYYIDKEKHNSQGHAVMVFTVERFHFLGLLQGLVVSRLRANPGIEFRHAEPCYSLANGDGYNFQVDLPLSVSQRPARYGGISW